MWQEFWYLMSMNLSNIAILKSENADYCCIISAISKSEAKNYCKILIWLKKVEHYKNYSKFTTNSNLNEKNYKWGNLKAYIKIQKAIIKFGENETDKKDSST